MNVLSQKLIEKKNTVFKKDRVASLVTCCWGCTQNEAKNVINVFGNMRIISDIGKGSFSGVIKTSLEWVPENPFYYLKILF